MSIRQIGSIATAGTLALLVGALGAVSFAAGGPGALLTAKSLTSSGC